MPSVTRALAAVSLALTTAVWVIHTVNAAQNPGKQMGTSKERFLFLAVGTTPWWWCIPAALISLAAHAEIFPFVLNELCLLALGSQFEILWGHSLFFTFIIFVFLPSVTCELVVVVLRFAASKSYSTSISGMGSVAAGLTVVAKQLMPEHVMVVLFGRVRLRLRWLPLCFLGVSFLLRLAGFNHAFFSHVLGFLVSWAYLRFVQVQPDPHANRTHRGYILHAGDASDSFAFVCFFPRQIQPALSLVVDPVYSLVLKSGIISEFTPEEVDIANTKHAARISGSVLPIMNPRATSERRRSVLSHLDL